MSDVKIVETEDGQVTHREMALYVDYYRTALAWKEIRENGAELDEPRPRRRRR